jgi:hypothetical protein
MSGSEIMSENMKMREFFLTCCILKKKIAHHLSSWLEWVLLLPCVWDDQGPLSHSQFSSVPSGKMLGYYTNRFGMIS